jgi:hypothetical protein
MAAIKPLEASAQKWTRRAQVAGEDYRAGVTNPRTPWDQASIAADSTYRQAVTQAATAGRYMGGIRKAGIERWRTNAVQKGPQRFAEGVQLAEGEWQRGFAPYQTAIGSLSLPARGPVGSPQNFQRVQAVATALRAVRDRTGTAR